ncbi:MAG: metallophosphoesterase, partial [Opitutaceae bacterium]
MLFLRPLRSAASLFTASILVAAATAHEGHDVTGDPPALPTLTITVPEGPRPWTSLDLNNNPRNFQFAIVSDNTGGMRPGVFEDAVRKLNWLQPEFVMSVGDLIQGYTEDRALLKVEWDAFEGFVEKLRMPFFYVAGNHDYQNPVQARAWRERFGASYYHFVYQDVLFVMLNSNDAERIHTMTRKQVEWLAAVLEDNPDPRWTLVFLHAPLWDMNDPSLWPQVEELLAGRKHTVFAGHKHSYVKHERNNANYYTLATTGGGSLLQGPRFGQFDHVMWATMTDDGPILANLLLEGIWPENLRTEESRKLQTTLIDGDSLIFQPIVFRGDALREGESMLRFTNDTDLPVTLDLDVAQTSNTIMRGERMIHRTVPPNEVMTVEYGFTSNGAEVAEGVLACVDWKVSFELDDAPFVFEGTKTIAAVRELPIPAAPAITIDGELADWPSLPFSPSSEHAVQTHDRTWDGESDSSFRFGVVAGRDFLYVGIDVTDDELYTNANESHMRQDSITVSLDARPPAIRNIAHNTDLDYTLMAGDDSEVTRVNDTSQLPEGSRHIIHRTPGGYSAEIAIPAAYLDAKSGKTWDGIRLNVSVADRDPSKPGRVSVSWRPAWPAAGSLPGSGSFFRQTG